MAMGLVVPDAMEDALGIAMAQRFWGIGWGSRRWQGVRSGIDVCFFTRLCFSLGRNSVSARPCFHSEGFAALSEKYSDVVNQSAHYSIQPAYEKEQI